MDPSGKVRVRWVDCGRSSGKESYVSRRNILEESVLVGDTITVRWGKSSRLYTAEVLNEDTIETVSNKQSAEETPTKNKETTVPKALKGRRLPTDLFTFELGKGASLSPSCRMELDEEVAKEDPLRHSIESRLKSIEEKLDRLLEARSREEERLTKVESLALALSETTVKKELETLLVKPKESPLNSSPAFLDLMNSQSPSVDGFRIPAGVLAKALDTCRGRRNLAGRLTQLIFTEEERKSSNCRGVLGKRLLIL